MTDEQKQEAGIGVEVGDRIKITNIPGSADFYGTVQAMTPVEDSLGSVTGYSVELERDSAP